MPVNSLQHDGITLKDRVKKLRKENHYSQVELAKKLDVSQSVISLIESGNASVSIEILKKLSALFNRSCDWLIYGKDSYLKVLPSNGFVPMIKAKTKSSYVENGNKLDHLDVLDHYRVPGVDSDHYRIFEVEDDNMSPILSQHDAILCEHVPSLDRVVEGSVNVLVLKKDIAVGRISTGGGGKNKVLLQNENPAYKDIKANSSDIKEIWQVKSKITNSLGASEANDNSKINQLETEVSSILGKLDTILEKIK